MGSLSRVALALAFVAACSDSSSSTTTPFTPLPDREPTDDAGADAQENPCGADLATDPANCGRCGNACAAGDHQAPTCRDGVCGARCETGWDDCDKSPTNGCEKAVASDPNNCGACGRSCAACGTATCNAGTCEPKTLATGQTDALGIALDGTHVYWTNHTISTGGVRRAGKDGTNVENVVTNASLAQDVVVIDQTYAYYTQDTQDGVRRTGLPGVYGPFPPFVSGQDFPGGLVADATGLYWTKTTSFAGAIMRCFNCGSAAVQVLGNLPPADKLAVDEKSVVVATGDSVIRVDKTGQNQATLAISQLGIVGLASDGKTVFFAKKGQTGKGEIAAVPATGGAVATLVATMNPESLTLAGENLYFGASAPEKVLVRADKTGRTVTLAKGLTAPGNVTVDDTCAYFVDGTTIRRVTK